MEMEVMGPNWECSAVAVSSDGMWIVTHAPLSPPIVASIVPISCIAHAGTAERANSAVAPRKLNRTRFVTVERPGISIIPNVLVMRFFSAPMVGEGRHRVKGAWRKIPPYPTSA
jgi:hypothetical protein